MKNVWKLLIGTSIIGSCLLSCNSKLPYEDPTLSADGRAMDLVKRLTLEEKVSLMQNTSPAIPRLGIKEYDWWNEALHGVGRAGVATVFPQCIGMAASFNDSLLFEVFTAVSDEARAKSNEFARTQEGLKRYQGLTFWTPNVNIFRDPRWGRGQETYGEDPYLTAQMGINVVRGLQGPENEKYDKLHACAKHFAVHSGPEWNRHIFNAENIAPRDLWETYLPAFKALVQQANVKEVMCAYNRYEGEPCCGSNRLLHQILRDEWGYQGIVVSDCWAINDFFTEGHHHTEPDVPHATAKAVSSGTDLECGESYGSLVEAVQQGLIDEATVDTSLHRLLKARIELGELDENVPWHQIPYDVVDSKEHRKLALRMAQESIVLLQNKNSLLPLKKEGLKIALIGPNANDSIMQWGNYNGFPSHTTTLLESLQKQLPASQLIYEHGCDHTAAVTLQSLFGNCTTKDGQKGFKASYWNTMEVEGEPDIVTQVPNPFHFTTAGATVFAPGVPLGGFYAVYETTFHPQKSEDIVFSFHTQGSAHLLIDGKQVASAANMKSNRVYTLKAEKGKSYNLKVTFAATEGDCATLNFDFGREVPLDLKKSVERVKDADVVIFAGGISPGLEGEEMPVKIPGFRGGDRENIELPAVQTDLLKELKKAGKQIVFVNFSGSAIALTREAQLCDAIIQAWYPGQAGGDAITSVLFGDYNPAGRLPVTFYKSTEQLPDFENYDMKGRTYRYMTETPLFPFGHGLSYTTFNYGNAKLSTNEMKSEGTCTLTIPVTNTGNRDGEEVIQIYLRRPADKKGPHHTLRAFKRISLKQGETRQVDFQLNGESFEWFDTETNTMHPLKGEYEILYGGTSDARKLKSIQIKLI